MTLAPSDEATLPAVNGSMQQVALRRLQWHRQLVGHGGENRRLTR